MYCVSIRSIERKMKKMGDNFREGRKRFGTGQGGKAIENYKILVQISEDLFDAFAVDQERQKVCQKEWGCENNG